MRALRPTRVDRLFRMDGEDDEDMTSFSALSYISHFIGRPIVSPTKQSLEQLLRRPTLERIGCFVSDESDVLIDRLTEQSIPEIESFVVQTVIPRFVGDESHQDSVMPGLSSVLRVYFELAKRYAREVPAKLVEAMPIGLAREFARMAGVVWKDVLPSRLARALEAKARSGSEDDRNAILWGIDQELRRLAAWNPNNDAHLRHPEE